MELPICAICRDDVVDFALPRADFQGAAYQFAIGLLQTVFAPADKYEWQDYYHKPPSEQKLKQAFDKAAHAFHATGDGPLFMQDFESLDSVNPVNISGLLIEAPGGNGLKLNTDHFIKRGIGEAMSLPMAMMALFTLQINAPSGGQGHRTGLRGGGPLTTLVMPQNKDANLWQKLWLNVMDREQWQYDEPDLTRAAVFPWLDKTRESKAKGSETYQKDVHPLHMYWAMPRRIRLIVEEQSGHCELTGTECESIVTQYITQNYGTNYSGTWSHPLTPYKRDLKKPEQEDLSIKGQPGGITYKTWDLLTLSGTSNKAKEAQFCAAVVKSFVRLCENELLDDVAVQPRLWAFGYDMDNMKARGWYSVAVPLFVIDADIQQEVLESVKSLQLLANDGLWQCRSQIKAAWFEKPTDAKGDFSFIDLSFWQRTEAAFYTAVKALIDNAIDGDPLLTSEQAKSWLLTIRCTAFDLFDELALSELGSERSMAKRIQARRSLAKGLASKAFKDFIEEHSIEFEKELA
jgi:CRISPR system Cascade subunit CasA